MGPWSHAPPSPVPASTRECNRRQQVVGVLNEFYVATFLHLYQLWKGQQKTIAESGAVLKGSSTPSRLQGMACHRSRRLSVPFSEVELFAKKNPKQMLRRLEVFLKARQAGGAPPRGASPDPQGQQASPSLAELGTGGGVGQGGQGKELHFTGVCDLPPDMEGEARLI